MRCAALPVQLLCAALGCVAIRITNEEFDVQPNLDFEVTWTDVVGDRVDVSLWEWPVYRYVQTLSNGNPRYGKETSRMVHIPHDLPPREYCFRVVEWPGGDSYDWSDGFFFNGTGEAVTTTTATTETSSTWSEATSSPTTTDTQPSNEAYPPNDDDDNTRPPLIVTRNRAISPLMLGLIYGGAAIVLVGVVACVVGHYRSKKKKKRLAAEAIADRAGGDGAATNGTSQGAAAGNETTPEKQEVATESNGVTEYYAPTGRA